MVGVSGSTAGPLRVIDELSAIHRPEPLDAYQRELVALVGRLLADGVDALEVTQAVAGVNDILTTRLLRLAEAELGPPPCRYAWLALGSHGRGEQVLSSDQDSALAFEDRDRSGRGPRLLPAAGGPGRAGSGPSRACRCATAATWPRRGAARSSEYRGLFRGWVEYPEPDALLKAEVFLDVRPVHGGPAVDVLDRILVDGGASGAVPRPDGASGRDVPPSARPVRPAAGQGLDDRRQAGRDRRHRAAGPALRARRRVDCAHHRGPAGGCRGRGIRSARARAANLAEAYRFLTPCGCATRSSRSAGGRRPTTGCRSTS